MACFIQLLKNYARSPFTLRLMLVELLAERLTQPRKPGDTPEKKPALLNALARLPKPAADLTHTARS